ncbi:type II toxin-antitoxin system Phd/YefM family antitoxin [Agathobacter sp.]
MAVAADLLQSLVPISQFNKGQASKIFDRLRSEKELIVLKNNQPSAIILSPEEYTRLTEIEEDYFLLLAANKRIETNGDKNTIPIDAVITDLGISKEELLDTEDVNIE